MFADGTDYQLFYSEMKKKGLVKDIGVDGTTCNNPNTYVIVVKNGNSYVYCLTMNCTSTTDTSTVVYNNKDSEYGTSTGFCEKVKYVNVNYNCGKGEGSNTFRVLSDKYNVDFDVCSRKGYSDDYFKVGTDTIYKSNTVREFYEDVTLDVHWLPNKYTIKYDSKCGTCNPASKSMDYDSEWGDLCSPSADNYKFLGWYITGTNTQVTKDSMVTGDTDVTAKWVSTIKPSCSITLSGTVGNNNWYTSNVGVTLNSNTNGGSSITNYGLSTSSSKTYNSKASVTHTTDGDNITYYGYVKNEAGLEASCSTTFKMDTVAPYTPYITFNYISNPSAWNSPSVAIGCSYWQDWTNSDRQCKMWVEDHRDYTCAGDFGFTYYFPSDTSGITLYVSHSSDDRDYRQYAEIYDLNGAYHYISGNFDWTPVAYTRAHDFYFYGGTAGRIGGAGDDGNWEHV